jgi:XTP/dITP diphosphohydrolase
VIDMTVQPGSAFLSLVEVMDRLRSPGGCPWDARQTHESLVEYLVEETYETVEAIETGDRAGLREELGDLLLQVVFHARIAQEDPENAWGIDDVVEGIIAKLVGRHPHVFGDEVAGTADEVEANWHARKAIEKGRTSVTDGIPMQLPALVLAAKVLARSVAFTDDLGESSRHEAALAAVDDVFSEEAFGDLLLGLVTIGRDEGWDAEAALRGATRRRIDAIRAIEANDG